MIDHVIFDLDGTLVDSVYTCVEIANQMLAERGSDRVVDVEFTRPYMSAGGVGMIKALLGSDCGDCEVELGEFRGRYAHVPTPAECLYEGVREGLTKLHQKGVGLSICSNKPQNLCEKVLGDLELAGMFTAVIGGLPDRRPKPAPDLLDLTIKQLGSSAQRCVYVGDSELDLATAQACTMPFIFLSYGYANPDWTAEGCVQFERFGEAVALVHSLHRPHHALRATVR